MNLEISVDNRNQIPALEPEYLFGYPSFKAVAPHLRMGAERKSAFSECTLAGCDRGYLRISFLGRTTQRANSPIKAPAAAMAIIGCPPNLVYP